MTRSAVRHFALIPAKERSSRCPGKNWRPFLNGDSLVDFTIKNMAREIFDKVIISTDKLDYSVVAGADLHVRDKELAGMDSCVIDLMRVIVRAYNMSDDDYLWLLNPTSPFRQKEDYRRIARTIEAEAPNAVISVACVSPFVWKGRSPLFPTKGKRPNTQDIRDEYGVENGMFYVINVGHFRRKNSWYGRGVKLYRQTGVRALVDIDTEEDFEEAQTIGRLFIALKKE
jgi:CMP-N-acetylneuraminic acid synthetase